MMQFIIMKGKESEKYKFRQKEIYSGITRRIASNDGHNTSKGEHSWPSLSASGIPHPNSSFHHFRVQSSQSETFPKELLVDRKVDTGSQVLALHQALDNPCYQPLFLDVDEGFEWDCRG